MSDLKPPPKTASIEDPGAHQLESSDEEHFSDASEGANSAQPPIPTTRVERVDAEPCHGETPGTEAYDIRTQDAQPDELEIIPEEQAGQNPDTGKGDDPIPSTVIDKVEPEKYSHGEVPNTAANDMRKADAQPDEVRLASATARSGSLEEELNVEVESPAADGADDDFDDFEEGNDDDDFGAFGVGEEQDAIEELSVDVEEKKAAEQSSFPALDYDKLESAAEISKAGQTYLQTLFAGAYANGNKETEQLPEVNAAFLTERSQSLWAQLVAPPPLQPPDWVRSRIRRLFLVSLGVPVDLDEILPASKQKKLVLPSIDVGVERSSTSANEHASLARVKQKNSSSSSVASTSTTKPERRRKGPPPPPGFDNNAARLLCLTTETALHSYTAAELREHTRQLEELKQMAVQSLEYWLIQKDSAAGDKDAFEEVIENLVKHAKRIRK